MTAALEENGIARATVGEIYEQIVNDLEASSKLFSNLPKQRGDYRINGTTVDILLSRVYLFMERYDETIAAADKAIQSAEGLTDYTALPGDTEFFMPTYDHSEVEWVYGAVSLESGMHVFAPARELMTYFEGKEDRREIFWFENNTKDEVQINKIAYSYQSVPNNTIRVSEAYLNRAEAYVLSGQANKNTLALADLNELRRHRIVGYEDVTIADETELLAEIREERYVELCYEGHRWFDLRRYAVNNTYPCKRAIEHVCYQIATDAGGSVIAEKVGETTLEEYNDNSFGSWMIPIPQSVIEFCDGNMKNPVRGGVTANFVIEEEEEETL